ncbi:hypothetical protein CDD80_2068 [Ophiocordyceps camponoti-rufipedis]|uniref:Uncharacterized protein n=1 Tax=Ophiocordyceps camponoti-rufipedis TaxID=2004952 RepID=A0A2C5Z1U4_9HYPO|nr:hypothetical protein CDD80_2068 [Ophiocordyceps camponoti-rufipedis]
MIISRTHGRLPRILQKPLLNRILCFRLFNTSVPDMASAQTSANGAPPQKSTKSYVPRYIDIGINLTDPMYSGIYNDKERHPDDVRAVIERASKVGCSKLIVTGSDIKSAWDALKMAEEHPNLYVTAGIHPCNSLAFAEPNPLDPNEHLLDMTKSDDILTELKNFIEDTRLNTPHLLAAFGEFGLDYDRLSLCNKTVQLHSFRKQLEIAASLSPQLPLFLHSRAAHDDFVSLLKEAFGDHLERLESGGVVHSFTGTYEEMMELTELGLRIGVNGCSFKTKENCDVVSKIPLRSIMLETDGPWCEVRPSHEGWKLLLAAKSAEDGGSAPTEQQQKQTKKQSKAEPQIPMRFKSVKKEQWKEGLMVKGRNEPCNIELIAQIVATIHGVTLEEVCEAAWSNTIKLFGIKDEQPREKMGWYSDNTNYQKDATYADEQDDMPGWKDKIPEEEEEGKFPEGKFPRVVDGYDISEYVDEDGIEIDQADRELEEDYMREGFYSDCEDIEIPGLDDADQLDYPTTAAERKKRR